MAPKNPTLDLLTGRASAASASAPTTVQVAKLLEEGVLRPSEVLARAKANVEHIARNGEIRVVGEVSDKKVLKNGHITFDMKDKRGGLPCIVYFNDTKRLVFELRQGLEIVATGKPSVTDWAQVQLKVTRVEPVGEGAHELAFRELKAKLETEGMFAQERKRALPKIPATIGVVTSSTGAAIKDVIKVLFDRMPGLRVVISQTKVQVEGASADIAKAIRDLDNAKICDVILVVRGGGSLEDLWAFNTEPVARAIFHAKVPVVTGVGHETDVTIADLVADKRAATPSNAAEIVTARTAQDLARQLENAAKHLAQLERNRLSSARIALDRLRKRLADPTHVVARRRSAVSDLAGRLDRAMRARLTRERRKVVDLELRARGQDPGRQIAERRTRLAKLNARLEPAVQVKGSLAHKHLDLLVARLSSISPLTVLARGYAIAQRADDARIIRAANDVNTGTKIVVRVERGEIKATVNE